MTDERLGCLLVLVPAVIMLALLVLAALALLDLVGVLA